MSIMQQASDCDKILLHDDDLLTIDGIGDGTVSGLSDPWIVTALLSLCWRLLVTLGSDMMGDLLRKSNIKIHKFGFGELQPG